MKQNERRLYLINCLLEENSMLGGITIPSNENAQEDLLRTLFALREPSGAPLDFLLIQNDYLKEEIKKTSIETDGLYTFTLHSPITIECDALVHFADNSLMGSFTPGEKSLDADLHYYAGIELRLSAADATQKDRGLLKSGDIRITPAFNLPGENIIHAIGPTIKREVTDKDQSELKSLIYGVLETIDELSAKTVVLYPYTRRFKKFPINESLKIMFDAIKSYPIDKGTRFIIALDSDSEIEIAKSFI